MKKINKFLLMGSVALTGAMGLASCSSEDAPDTPGNGDVTTVKTQFAINIPRANGGTRMSATNAQANKNFLGMTDIAMLTFSAEPTASSTSTGIIGLGEIEVSENLNEDAKSSKIYSDVNVPIGTSHFLFYATAPQGTDAAGKFEKGYLKLNLEDTNDDGKIATSTINATLGGVMGTDTNNEDQAITTVLNRVASVTNWATSPDGSDLKNFYNSFISLKAGSATSVCKELEKLYNELEDVMKGDATTSTIITNIRAAITQDGTFAYDDATKTLSTTLTYPRNINLPDGAVMLDFTTNNSFEYATTSNNVGTSFMGLNAADVCFPASIYYFQSSNLAASAQVLETGNWPTSTSGWTTSGTAPWLDTNGSLATGWTDKVNAATRSIAMRQNINYGVASLYLQAKCNASSLADNTSLSTMGTFTGTVNIPAEGLKVTGLLIGGQPAKVGYDFQPDNTDEQFAKVVYDKAVDGYAQASTSDYSASNYTIVLPNEIAGASEQNPVNIAVEFENNTGVDFRGADGIVPNGGKFYLVGKLNPKAVPGQTINGKTDPAVFMSDYMTTAKVNVSSLANAYNTIPDLRSTKMQLGISVDLTWQRGLTFDVTLN